MRIELRDVSASHGEQPALRGVTLAAVEGEFLALLGPSGSGKSTLLSVVAGLHPGRGEVLLDGQPADRLPPQRRGIGMVFQDLALWPHLSVEGHLRFVHRDEARIAEVLAELELTPLKDRRPAELSGGEAQRLALARAIVGRPRALLLDEPLGSLDRRLRDRMIELVRALHRRHRTTTILVTHDYDEAFALADRVAVLAEGRVLQAGTPEEVYRRPVSRSVAELGGAASFVPGSRNGEGVHLPWGVFPASGAEGSVLAMLRPTDVELAPGGDAKIEGVRFRAGGWEAAVGPLWGRISGKPDVGCGVSLRIPGVVWCLSA